MNRLAIALLLLLAGCSQSARFEIGFDGRDPKTISDPQREAITNALDELFGTPGEPRLPQATSEEIELLQMAAGEIGSDESGRRWGLFRHHCVACHGISGNGNGATAAVLSPYPRDFRDGLFKYTSTAAGARPLGEDLRRTLRRGIPGTAMPSFMRLDDREIEALVAYVRYLSLRGQTELFLVAQVLDEDEPLPLNLETISTDAVLPAIEAWTAAKGEAVSPPKFPKTSDTEQTAATARGRSIYLQAAARCAECHGSAGQGDGVLANALYDDWNKRKLDPLGSKSAATVHFPLPPVHLRPRNLAEGIFHGGDRTEDLYWRIALGIKGTPMPGASPGPRSPKVLGEDEIGDLIAYIRSLNRAAGE